MSDYLYYCTEGKVDIPVMGFVFEKNSDEKIPEIFSVLKTKAINKELYPMLQKNKRYKLRRLSERSFRMGILFDFRLNGAEYQQISQQPVEVIKNSSIVTYARVENLRNMIFFKEEIDSEAGKNKMIKEISKKMIDQSPIPIPENLLSEVSEVLIPEAKELSIIGSENFPYKKILTIDVNSEKSLLKIQNVLIKEFSEKEFLNSHGRVPRISSLLNMIDVRKLKMKTWKNVLDFFGGKEEFEKLPDNIQKSVIWGYEVLEDKIIDLYKKNEELGVSFDFYPFKEAAVNKCKNKSVFNVDRFIARVKEINNAYTIYSFISLLSDKKFIKNFNENTKSVAAISEYLSSIEFENVAKGCEIMELVAKELGLSQESFSKYQKAYLESMEKQKDEPLSYPTIKKSINKDYSWESIDMRNVRAWFVGLETHCCQHLDSVGGSCVLYAANHVRISGILRVMKKGKTVAQSFFWYHEESGTFVLDNIEVLGNELRQDIIDCYMDFANELEKRKNIFGYKCVTFGAGYTDIDTRNFDRVGPNGMVKLSQLPGGSGVYSDANSVQFYLKKFEG